MATTTRVLTANVNGTVYTANANGALEAIDTCHAGATAPTDEVANGKFWLDTSTTPGILKMYNNAVWEEIGGSTSSPTFDSLEVGGTATLGRVRAADGTSSAPAYTFDIDGDTGFYRFSNGRVDYVSNGDTKVTFGNAATTITNLIAPIADITTLETDEVQLYSPNGLNGYKIRSDVSNSVDDGLMFETPDGTDIMQIGKNNSLVYHSDIEVGGKFSETHSNGFWKDTAASLALHQLRGRVMGGYAQDFNGEQRATQSGGGWSMTGDEGDNVPAEFPAGTRAQWFVGQAQMAVSCHDEGAIAVSGISRTSGSNFAVGVSGFVRNQYLAPLPDTNPKNAWGVYAEAVKASGLGARGGTWAIETGTMNFDADPGAVKVDPFNSGYAGQTKGLMLNSGGGNTNAFPIDVFLQFRGDYASGTKGARSYAGLVAADTSLVQTVSHAGSPATGKAIMLSATANHAITWSTAADDVITEFYAAAGGQIILNRMEAPTATPFAMDFRKDGSSKGSIQFTAGGGVAYQSNSDERLKENITPAAYTPSLLDDLKVRSFDWKADGHHVSHGFIAQELHEVLPSAVSEGTDLDELSSAEDVWQIDQAAIIPLLVQELQELRKRVAELEVLEP